MELRAGFGKADIMITGMDTSPANSKRSESTDLCFAWTVHPLPKGQKDGQLDHLCRRPICCNPIHLEFVTGKINMARRAPFIHGMARRTYCKWGHPLSGDNLLKSKTAARLCRRCRDSRQAKLRQTEHSHEYHRNYMRKYRLAKRA